MTRQPRLETQFYLTWTIKSEQRETTNALCLFLLRHVIFWKPCQIPLFQQNLTQNLDYQSASPIRLRHSFSPSRVLIHFYPALFQIPPGLVLGSTHGKWLDGTVTKPEWIHTSVSDKNIWLVKIKNVCYHLLKSICREWSTVRSVGQAGLTFTGSPPAFLTASLMAAKSTIAGIPLTDGKSVKHHETLTHWNAQTCSSFSSSLEVAMSYFRKYTYCSLNFKGLEPFLKSLGIGTPSQRVTAMYQTRTWDHLKDSHTLLHPALFLRCDGTSAQKGSLDTPYLCTRTLLCKQSSSCTFNTGTVCLTEPFLNLVAFHNIGITVQNRGNAYRTQYYINLSGFAC